MTQVPALREALQDAARRRYGRRRRARFLIAVPAAGALAAAVVLLPRSPTPEQETVATPTPNDPSTVRTVKITPLPTPEGLDGPPIVVRARVLDDAEDSFKAEGGTSNGTLELAWTTPGMQGEDARVFLFRRGETRCLSVPDPLATEPGDRGVTCSPPDVFERFGVSLTIGSNYAAVVPDPDRPPMYRHADGTRETLKPVAGLVALARTNPGSAVALYAPDGKRRTDAFREDPHGTARQMDRHECSNGEEIIVARDVTPETDQCTAMAEAIAKEKANSRVSRPQRP